MTNDVDRLFMSLLTVCVIFFGKMCVQIPCPFLNLAEPACFFIYIYICNIHITFYFLFLAVPGLCCWEGFSLVAASKGYSLVVAHGLPAAVASLVAEYGL